MQYAQVSMQQTTNHGQWSKKLFTFSCNINELVEGDILIADTIIGMMIVKFKQYTDKPYGDGSTTKPIICKVDLKNYFTQKQLIEKFLKE